MHLCCNFPEAVAIHCFIRINKCHRYNRHFGIHRTLKYTCLKILKGIFIVAILTFREKQIYFTFFKFPGNSHHDLHLLSGIFKINAVPRYHRKHLPDNHLMFSLAVDNNSKRSVMITHNS